MILNFDSSPSYSNKTISRLDIIFNNKSSGYDTNPIKDLKELAASNKKNIEDYEHEREYL